MQFLSLLALGAPLVSAIQFTNPAANSTVTRGANFDLKWSSVDTDPDSFSVYLVNFVNWPPYYEPLALGLETSAGGASVRVPCDVDDSYGFQFNAINGTNVYIIYSQTPKFSIVGDACTDPVTTTAPASSCAAAPTVTQTVTVRGNSTLLRGSGAAAGAATTAAPQVKLVPKDKFQGTCPGTIGWSKDYSHPVTLTETPRAGRSVAAATATATVVGSGPAAAAAQPTATAAASAGDLTKPKDKSASKAKGKGKCSARKHKRRSVKGPKKQRLSQ